MFTVDQRCVLINRHDCCYKSIYSILYQRSYLNAASNDLFICRVNILSLSKNIDKLEEFLEKCTRKIDIICISQKMLTESKLKSVTIPGYQMYCCNFKSIARDAAIYVANLLIAQQQNEGCEDVWVEILCKITVK